MAFFSLVSTLFLFISSGLAAYITIPLYIEPSDWQILETAIASYPHLTFNLIVNPNSGPGDSQYPEDSYIQGLASLNAHSNVQTVGYVHIEWGSRALPDVQAEINKYAGWSSYSGADIHVSGIFVDEAPADYSEAYHSYLTTVSNAVKSVFPSGKNHVAFNPGAVADASYYSLADSICIYEFSASGYTADSIAGVSAQQKASSTVIMYGFSGSGDQQAQLVSSIAGAGVAGIFITAADGYTQWSSLFSQLVESVAGTSSGSGAAPPVTPPSMTVASQAMSSMTASTRAQAFDSVSPQSTSSMTTSTRTSSSVAPQKPSSTISAFQMPAQTLPTQVESVPSVAASTSSLLYATPSSTTRRYRRPIHPHNQHDNGNNNDFR